MKICFICGEYPPGPHGGIGTMTQLLGRSLARQGHEVRAVGVYPPDYQASDFEVDRGVRIWRLRDSLRPGRWVASRYQLYRKVYDWAKQGDIDIAEVPDYHGWSAGWGRLTVPVISRLHGSMTYFAAELQRPVNKIATWLERASLRRADYACSVSQYTLDMTQRLFGFTFETCPVLYNPIDLPPCAPRTERIRNRVVFSGTLTPKKGVLALIKAWPKVVHAHPGAELHIFGKNGRADDGQSMQDLLTSLLNGARHSVHFHGHVPREKLLDVYRTAGVAVFPSRAEAFAMAPLEAMASGCPTIYSRKGSGPELLADGLQGLLVDPDDHEGIAEAILRLQSDPSFAQQLGETGRSHVRDCFSIEKLTDINLNFYDRCIRDFRLRHSN